MRCPHLVQERCEIASQLAGRDVVPWENVCETCSTCEAPQQENYVTASIAIHVWDRDGDHATAQAVRDEVQRRGLRGVGRAAPEPTVEPPPGPGPGTELKSLFGLLRVPMCPHKCRQLMLRMNELGVAGCRTHRAWFLKQLRKNAKRYNWSDKIKAAAAAVKIGIAHRIDLTDPIAWCFDFAVCTADQKQAQLRRNSHDN